MYVGKANLKLYKMIMMGFFAGMFIAIGAEGSNLAVHTVDNFGLAKTLAGCIFPVETASDFFSQVRLMLNQ